MITAASAITNRSITINHGHGHHSGAMDDDEFPIHETADAARSPSQGREDSLRSSLPHNHETVTNNITNQGDHTVVQGDTHIHQMQRGLGVAEAIKHIMEATNALSTRYERRFGAGPQHRQIDRERERDFDR